MKFHGMVRATEAQTLRAILDYLTLKGVLHIRLNPTKPFTDRRTSHLRFAPVRQGQAGAPDILLFLPGGRTVGVEVKSATGRQSPAQRLWQVNLEAAGVTYILARGLEDVMEVLTHA